MTSATATATEPKTATSAVDAAPSIKPGPAMLRVGLVGVGLMALAVVVIQTTGISNAATLGVVLAVAVTTLATVASVYLVARLLAVGNPATAQHRGAMGQLISTFGRVAAMAGGAVWIVSATSADLATVAVTMAIAYPVLLVVEAAGVGGLIKAAEPRGDASRA